MIDGHSLKLLNVGCGTTFHKAWVNIDMNGIHKEIINVDIRKGLPFEESSFDVVYSSHVLEHFSLQDASKLLNEIYRVLKPNGIVRIVVPDLEDITKKYLHSLDSVMEYESKATIFNYDWMYMELYDQTTRSLSGGNMSKRMLDLTNGFDFMFERIGYEMFNSQERELINRLPCIQKEESIYIFGAGVFGQRIEKILSIHSVRIDGYIDNSTALIGQFVDSFPVKSLHNIPKSAHIIIASTWWKEIEKQLREHDFTNYYIVETEIEKLSVMDEKLEEVREIINLKLGIDYLRAFDEGVFRNQGEIHRQMYDQYLLKRVLLQTGFVSVIKMKAFESAIPNFREYQLDEINGVVRKPDSLFMEAMKKLK
ncbi:class I SAM-dependent methyltransferase [Lysinibacillus sp. NPDC093190]|uniref:class I SAM-dependent methyltransferase n=1 Tax=Lysinibacillus sp. NPDC093190 TaxID=3390575 RepID=UPI003D052A74